MPSLEERTYELAKRALEQQEGALTELRQRTGTLLTAASITASFLGAQAITRQGLTTVVALALIAFVGSLMAAIYILLPNRGLIFAVNVPIVYEVLYEKRDDEPEVHRELAYWLQDWRSKNAPTLRRSTWFFWVASGLLLAEIVLFAVGLQQ
jgi:hypothetical protein